MARAPLKLSRPVRLADQGHGAQILSAGREIDGTPVNAIQDNWGDILQYNAQLFRSREPLSGPQAVQVDLPPGLADGDALR
jgi:hypothetical protein